MRTRFDAKLEAKAEQVLGLCAVWCVGPVDGVWRHGDNDPRHPVTFGTTTDPDAILKQARVWNWEVVDLLAVVWTASRQNARAVCDEIDDILETEACPIRGRWYDMTPDVAEMTIRMAADAVGVAIFDDATRKEKLRQQVRREIEKMRRAGTRR